MNPVALSIVIVNYETPEHTMQCIRSIYRHAPSKSFEIILIDNDSRDGSLPLIREAFPEILCIETGANLGFARANNLGISNARGEYVLLLNSDTKIPGDALDRMLGYLSANPSAGAVGVRQLDDDDGNLQLSWGSFPTFFSEIVRKVVHFRLSINDQAVRDYLQQKFSGRSEVDWVSGSCLMARRDTLVKAGLLDGRFFMYFEDIDLCRRIKDMGFSIHYDADATIIHYGGVSAKKNIMNVLLEYRKSQIYFTHKYYGLAGVLVLKLLLTLKYGVNLFRWSTMFLTDKLFRRECTGSFTKLLLSKKAIELIFSAEGHVPDLGISA